MPKRSPPSVHWPYPRLIAHRGAGLLAPENTLAAFRVALQNGYRMAECDVRISSDGMVYLMHDDTLDRTTNGHGPSANRPWSELGQLDAGGWHSPEFAGEPPPTLACVAELCLASGLLLNIEIKPSPGLARQTGTAVAREVQRLWAVAPRATWPLLSSFQPAALDAARTAAPALPRGLLLERLEADWLVCVQSLGCCAVIASHTAWTAARLGQARDAGLRTLAYTVNTAADAQRLADWGMDGLITDALDRFPPDA